MAQSHLEELNVSKEKAILESKQIVTDYIEYIDGVTGSAFQSAMSGSPKKSQLLNRMIEDASYLQQLGIDPNKVSECVYGNWFGLGYISDCITKEREKSGREIMDIVKDLNANQKAQNIIKTILRMRLNYVNRITGMMSNMIKSNFKILGLSEQEAQVYIDNLSKGGDDAAKTVGNIKEKIAANADKFMFNDGKGLDLRSLGFGVIISGEKDLNMLTYKSNMEVMLNGLIQKAMRFDVVVIAHGMSGSKKISANVDDINERIDLFTDYLQKEIKKYPKDFEPMLASKTKDRGFEFRKFENIINKLGDGLEEDWALDMMASLVKSSYKDIVNQIIDIKGSSDFSQVAENLVNKTLAPAFSTVGAKIFDEYLNKHNGLSDVLEKNGMGDIPQEKYNELIKLFKVLAQYAVALRLSVDRDILVDIVNMSITERIQYKDAQGEQVWLCQPTKTPKAGPFTDVNELVRQLIKEGFKKIDIEDCNPGHHKLAKDIMQTKGVIINYSNFSNFVESVFIDSNDPDLDTIHEMEDGLREFARSVGINYDDDNYLNECVTWCGDHDIDVVNEAFGIGALSNLFKKAIGAIINFIKKVLHLFKLAVVKLKALFLGTEEKPKKSEQKVPEIKTEIIDIKAKKTVPISGDSLKDIQEKASKINNNIGEEINTLKKNQEKEINKMQSDIRKLEQYQEQISKTSKVGESATMTDILGF